MERKPLIKKKTFLWLLILAPLFLASCPVIYSLAAMTAARIQGVYASPQEGVNARANRYYRGIQSITIYSARTNRHDGQDPHIWYVSFQICAAGTRDGGPMWRGRDCVNGGNFYLHMRDGWVMMGEGLFPEFVGWWMKTLGLAGA